MKNIINAYKDNFAQINKEEKYKWQAVGMYKKNWDIDADDFATMLEAAFKDADNLLNSVNYYPFKALCDFSKAEPETVRALFKVLYDEEMLFEERVKKFREGFDEYFKPQDLNHYQDLHAITVYLSFEFPKKYYIYKYSVIKGFIKKIGYECGNIDAMTDAEKMNLTMELLDSVLKVVEEDEELKAMSRCRLDETCHKDEAFHMLANDIVYFGSKYELKETLKVMTKPKFDKNIILYGPPGTGKTYNTVIYAVAIVENKSLEEISKEEYKEIVRRYNDYKSEGKIEFTTFHQSYGYEEFIEGIKPITNDEGEVYYDIVPGVFKAFCENAKSPAIEEKENLGLNDKPTVWKVSLWGTGKNPIRTDCMENGYIRLGFDGYGPEVTGETDYSLYGGKNVLNAFIGKMKIGDLVLSCYSNSTIDAIGVVAGDYEWDGTFDVYNRVRKVKWLVKGIEENILRINGGKVLSLPSVYELDIDVSDVMEIVRKYSETEETTKANTGNYVFVIDEINRGNISKILGELITLIEDSKRIGEEEATTAKLPYSQKEFGVPNNVYIIGTMNTADRSIAAIDTALRRRFSFREMMPQAGLLSGVNVEDISVSDMIEKMNKRIEVLYDREHTIGHAYFMPLKKDNSIEMLAEIFKNKILPLLQEYFYEDYEKIRLVLGDNQKTNDGLPEFVKKEQVIENDLFGEDTDVIEDAYKYTINEKAFEDINAYKKLI